MKLKHYQEKVLTTLKEYLSELNIARKEFSEMTELKPHLALNCVGFFARHLKNE